MLPTAPGLVTVAAAGTPVPLATASDTAHGYPQDKDLWCHRLVCKAPFTTPNMTGNAGAIYIGKKGLNRTTGANVIMVLLPGDSQALDGTGPGNCLWVPGIYVDADNTGDSVLPEMDII